MGREKLTELTAAYARYETICALSKNKEAVEEYEQILNTILEAAKQGKTSVSCYDIGKYSILCLTRDGFHIQVWTHRRGNTIVKDYDISWD